MIKMETFSAHSLKILEDNRQEYLNRYKLGTHFVYNPSETKLGKKFHALISYYLKGFEISKLENALSEDEYKIWVNLKNDPILKNEFAGVEYSFLVKEDKFYLTGRFDAVVKCKDEGQRGAYKSRYIILDWKMKNLPKNPKDDIQSVVYLYCASKVFNTTDISIIYCSISTLDKIEVKFDSKADYYKRVAGITELV